jgi:putative cardiolipin synthase
MNRVRPLPAVVALAAVALLTVLGGCASLPQLEPRTPSVALADTRDTRLGRALAPAVAANPGRSGIHSLPAPRDAFAARVLLAAAADRSIDAQYYIWHADVAGHLLFEALWRAAERGVRVRLLLDDLNTKGLDPLLASLDGHPRIEVRLYNPLANRGLRALDFMGDFSRVNRRMHNKSFTVDNQVTVVGGRNIGNEYFAAGSDVEFVDLDVAAVGAVVPAVSADFDRYWNSASAYPAARLVRAAADAVDLQARFAAARAQPEAAAYLAALRATPIVRALLDRQLALQWTPASVVSDDPAKTLDANARADLLLFPELMRAMGAPARSLDLISPYFVPGEAGTAALVALAQRGVPVRILTNSLAASDVGVVHAGYAKRREALLKGGVRLYELKPSAGFEAADDRGGIGSSSSSGLHAKTFAVDRARIFIGSFNFDPRSARLNTEMGLVIDSPTLAARLAAVFDEQVARVAYEVRLGPDGGGLQWIERTPDGERRYDDEPASGWWKRLQVHVLSVLPIEWLL